MSSTAVKEHAHQLIDRMEPAQLSVLVNMLEDLLDPLTDRLASAPLDDEPTTDADNSSIARSYVANTVTTAELLQNFGLTVEAFYKLADDPLSASTR